MKNTGKALIGFVVIVVVLGALGRASAESGPYKAYFPIYIHIVPTLTPTRTPRPTLTPSPTPTPDPRLPPPYSTSYYMKTVNQSAYKDLGCEHGQRDVSLPGAQDSIVVLDFGRPVQTGSTYGASLFGFGTASVDQIAEAVKEFGEWYVECSRSDRDSRLRIGVGTTNYGSQVTYAHGRAWAGMVNDINAWFERKGYIQRVRAAGASDMELGWNGPLVTRAWVDGYDEVNLYELYNFGDAAGCPSRSYPHWSCSGGWTQEDIWYVSYGVGAAYPLPLIYATSGINAEQWYFLSLYAYRQHGMHLDIKGAFTQYQACQQRGNCAYIDNKPQQGWRQLYNELNSDARTAQKLRWSTDIKWWGE